MKSPTVFVLPPDVLIIPAADLSPDVRRRARVETTDYVVSRPKSRTLSRVIDAAAAEFLESFRQSSTVVDAVLRYSQARRLDAEEVLEGIFPLLRQLWSDGHLVPPDSEAAKQIEPMFTPGTVLGGCVIRRCVHAAEDTEVYEVDAGGGTLLAAKISRPGSGANIAERLAREAMLLTRLDGVVNPRLQAQGSVDGRPFLLLDWCTGVDAASAATVLRQNSPVAAQSGLLRLGAAILRAFARLHEQGVIHGDVHPRNVVVGPDGAIKILDFGLARLLPADHGRQAERGGIGYYFEPELARAFLRDEPSPAASEVGEQYALAALLYFLFTEKHYRDFALDRDEFLRQVVEEMPLSFSAQGVGSWPDVERILARALLKDPADRFPSLTVFADELAAAAVPHSWTDKPGKDLGDAALLESVLDRLGPSGDLLGRGLAVTSPTCSVNYGAAGIAYAFYRVACLRGDAALLSTADLWSTRAWRDLGATNAFLSEEFDLTDRVVAPVSLYHRASGVHCVRALVNHALGDPGSAGEAVRDFVAASRLPCTIRDLATGRASTLIGCSTLLEALPNSPLVNKPSLRGLGDEIFREMWGQLDALPPIHRCDDCRWLGMAHGWAGFLYATMRWCRASGTAIPPALGVRLDQLAELAQPVHGGLGWGVRAAQNDQEPWPGWCHGSAGYVHLWLLALQTLGESDFQRLAEGAAWHAWTATNTMGGNLCCGYAGQAYALLAIWRHGGDHEWLTRAAQLGNRAAAAGGVNQLLSNSLYKGELGIALLAEDLTQPDAACMPLFEPEGWPLSDDPEIAVNRPERSVAERSAGTTDLTRREVN